MVGEQVGGGWEEQANEVWRRNRRARMGEQAIEVGRGEHAGEGVGEQAGEGVGEQAGRLFLRLAWRLLCG
jgi:hypothetical protein